MSISTTTQIIPFIHLSVPVVGRYALVNRDQTALSGELGLIESQYVEVVQQYNHALSTFRTASNVANAASSDPPPLIDGPSLITDGSLEKIENVDDVDDDDLAQMLEAIGM